MITVIGRPDNAPKYDSRNTRQETEGRDSYSTSDIERAYREVGRKYIPPPQDEPYLFDQIRHEEAISRRAGVYE